MVWQALAGVPEELQVGALVLGLAIAVIFHEVAHGYVALLLGDPTAYYAGRLTLNPLRHIDLWGTILIPLLLLATRAGFVFGWAKPVPVNYRNLRYPRLGPVVVALAGPLTNFAVLVVAALLARLSPAGTALPFLFVSIAMVNAALMLFNLLPIPPLDGSKVLYVLLERRPDVVAWVERNGFLLLIFLLIFAQRWFSAVVFGPAAAIVRALSGFAPF